MTTLGELIQSELNEAIQNKNTEAIRRVSFLISDKISKIEQVEKIQSESKSDIQLIAEQMKKGFELMEARFKSVDDRFKAVDRRFDDMHKRITQQTWFIGSGFIIINAVIMLLKFFG